MIEYRLCWNASTNISFEGASDWAEWGGFEETEEEVQNAASSVTGTMNIPQGLEEVLEASGFEWWVETRVAAASSKEGGS